MCGICGIVVQDGPEQATSLAGRMIEAVRHRGPDGGGVTHSAGVTLAMARLAIVDIGGGQQPMFDEAESVALVFNGEIYNAPALRLELEADGILFRTRSDTEVILRRYQRDPETVENALAGMWAFAIHDRSRKKLVLSRDRFGIKPLFIAQGNGAIAFASELRCFVPVHRHPAFHGVFELDPDAAHAMVSWGYVPDLATPYRGVKRLAPGTRLELDLRSHARPMRRYWKLRPSPAASAITSLAEACEVVEAAMRQSVREHLESDVPVATFLSGGVDSSLIAAWATEVSKTPITAYSIGFKNPRFDEAPYARETAKQLGIEHRVEYLTEADACSAVVDALLAYDEPFGDSSSVATLLLARLVAKTHKVALGGDGGDEVFAGYRKHQVLRVRSALQWAPAGMRLLQQALDRLPTAVDRTRRWTEALRTLQRLARGLEADDADAWVALTQVVPLSRAAALMARPGDPALFLDAGRAQFTEAEGDRLQRTLASDLGSPLANDMLTKVDRATMAVSLEARVPFLDHRVVELGVGLPGRFTLPGGKRVLRSLHERRFGKRLARRRKMGFGVPVEAWLGTTLAPACDALFATERLERHGLLSAQTLGDGQWRKLLATDAYLVWHALALAAWCEVNLGDGPDHVRSVFRGAR